MERESWTLIGSVVNQQQPWKPQREKNIPRNLFKKCYSTAATRILLSSYCQPTAKQLRNASSFCFSPLYALFSLDTPHWYLVSTKSVVSVVFVTAVLLLFTSFTVGPGYATNCRLVSISCSFGRCPCYILYLNNSINYLFLFESHLHIFTSK